jgi:2-amino-4-hydroxy-6-hydroxymethyldihydropteridine diphosphokinase
MATAYIALGSNLGDRHAHLDHALSRCGEVGTVVAGSPMYETDAVGGPAGQSAFLNAVLCVRTELGPRPLLEALLAIEAERDRTRDVQWGPRTLDLDILSYDGLSIDEPGLTIPHPEIRRRRFVLTPLADLEPGLSDESGPFLDSLSNIDGQGVRRISGPVHPDGSRWMVGLEQATELTEVGEGFVASVPSDWANTSQDAFGGFLMAVALRSIGRDLPNAYPSQFSYRFLRPVPSGSTLQSSTRIERRGSSSSDVLVELRSEGHLVGSCAVGLTHGAGAAIAAPPVPKVVSRSEAIPVANLIEATGSSVGMSARSWAPLERWDMPDLIDGTESVVRAWSPNVVAGTEDQYLIAASILMPIDAVMWPATMQILGPLGGRPLVSTPTVEIAARFANLVQDAWQVAEAQIDHRTGSAVAGTVRVWGESGAYAAIGHSFNLVRE